MIRIAVGEGSCGIAAGAASVYDKLSSLLTTDVTLGVTGCIGMCFLEPIVDVYDGDALRRESGRAFRHIQIFVIGARNSVCDHESRSVRVEGVFIWTPALCVVLRL